MKRLFLVLFLLIFTIVGVVGTALSGEDIELALSEANTDSDLMMYVFYRSETSGNHVLGVINSPHYLGATQCTANDTSCINYWDIDLPWEKTLYYIVTAVDLAGNESGKSNEVSYTTPVEPDLPPRNPVGCYIRTVVP